MIQFDAHFVATRSFLRSAQKWQKKLKPGRNMKASLDVEFDSETEASRVFEALKPEIDSAPSDKAETVIDVEDKTLFLRITSGERAPFRAAVNTYMKWIRIAHELGGK